MSANLVYVTTRDKDEARRIGRAVVEERLAACVNILDGMNAIYRWDGAVQDDDEAVLIAKTTAARRPALIARIQELHSDDCPCIVVLPILDGNPDFLAWIEKQTE